MVYSVWFDNVRITDHLTGHVSVLTGVRDSYLCLCALDQGQLIFHFLEGSSFARLGYIESYTNILQT